METINTIELNDENEYPDEVVLQGILGKSYPAYLELLGLFQRHELEYLWRYYKDGKAWLCKVQKKKKTIVWMSAWNGYMQASIYFPIRRMDDVFELDISEEIKGKFRNTKNVGKSKPCIFEIRNPEILNDFDKVMRYKIRSK